MSSHFQQQAEKYAGELKGLAIFMDYNWLLLDQMARVLEDRLGKAGNSVLQSSLYNYGYARGQYLRDLPEVILEGMTPGSLLRCWDTGEWLLAALNSELSLNIQGSQVEVLCTTAPGANYFRDLDTRDALNTYWHAFLSGLAEGFDEQISITCDSVDFESSQPWRVRISGEANVTAVVEVDPLARLDDGAALIRMSRQTTGALGGLAVSVGRELRVRYDAAGDAIFREMSYGFGAMRGKRLREQHLANGMPLDFNSFFGGIQERDEDESIFIYRGERHVSPGVFQVDCTYCPLAQVWQRDGADTLELAYLFDLDNHRGLIESYNPDALVRWDEVKSRGDSTCKFRFVIPNLVTDTDPEWAQAFKRALS